MRSKPFGYPHRLPVAVDALALFVNKDNPTKGLTIAEVDALFFKVAGRGHPTDLTRWGQLGHRAIGPMRRSVSMVGIQHQNVRVLQEHALKNGDFKDQVKEQPGSASVVQGINGTDTALDIAVSATVHRE